MSKDIVKANKLVPFLNQKNKADLKYRKEAVVERKEVFVNKVETINEQEGTVWCTISTQGVDRMGDIVMSAGIDTEEYKKIPSIYINHDYSLLPIATCEELVHGDGEIKAKMKFVLSVPVIKNIFELVKAGAMKGISVGFDACEVLMKGTKSFDDMCKSMSMDVGTYDKVCRIITSWKLYEFSLVSIPANADCFVKSLTDGKQEVSPELVKYLGIKSIAEEDEDDEEEAKEPIKEDKPKDEEAKGDDEKLPEISAKELSVGAKSEMEDHADVVALLKDKGVAEEVINQAFELIAAYELAKDPDFYTEEKQLEVVVVQVKQLEVPIIKEIPRYIKVIKTAEDIQNEIDRTVEARLKGRTRLEIKVKE